MGFRAVLKNAPMKTGRIRAAAYDAVAEKGLDVTQTFDTEDAAADFCAEIKEKADQDFVPEPVS